MIRELPVKSERSPPPALRQRGASAVRARLHLRRDPFRARLAAAGEFLALGLHRRPPEAPLRA
jgi:hypothetical protein